MVFLPEIPRVPKQLERLGGREAKLCIAPYEKATIVSRRYLVAKGFSQGSNRTQVMARKSHRSLLFLSWVTLLFRKRPLFKRLAAAGHRHRIILYPVYKVLRKASFICCILLGCVRQGDVVCLAAHFTLEFA